MIKWITLTAIAMAATVIGWVLVTAAAPDGVLVM